MSKAGKPNPTVSKRTPDKPPLLCRIFGHKPSMYYSQPTYAKLRLFARDGQSQDHFRVLLTCERCDEEVHVANIHGSTMKWAIKHANEITPGHPEFIPFHKRGEMKGEMKEVITKEPED